jgi:hypothetical protein
LIIRKKQQMDLRFKRRSGVRKRRYNGGQIYNMQTKTNQKTDSIQNAIRKNDENTYTIIDKFISRFIL